MPKNKHNAVRSILMNIPTLLGHKTLGEVASAADIDQAVKLIRSVTTPKHLYWQYHNKCRWCGKAVLKPKEYHEDCQKIREDLKLERKD